MNRREFISASVLGASGLVLNATAHATHNPLTFDPYERVQLGKTGIQVSRVCLGTGMRGGGRNSNHTRMGQEKFTTLVRGALERGINMFDSADLYGTHTYLANALQGVPREDYVVVTKIWFRSGGIPEPERLDADVLVDRFRKELKTDYIDLLLMHCVVSPDWPTELRKQMDLLAGMKAKGIIRAHGVSSHSKEAFDAAIREPWVDSVHERINPYGAAMSGEPEEIAARYKQLKKAGKGTVAMKIMGEGRFRNNDEERNASVKYALTLGCIDVLNVGCETLEEVDDLAARIQRVPR